jgi:hypothetical protein
MSAPYLRGKELEVFQQYNTASAMLHLSEATRWVYIGPNGAWFDLEGRQRGRQGVRMTPELVGAHHLPFEHLFTESAYQVGSTYERSNILKRTVSMGVTVGGPKYSAHQYRLIENNWWDAWPLGVPGWLGCNTRFGGWRWIAAMLGDAVRTSVKQDPTAHSNNMQRWDMSVVMPKPYFAKPMVYKTWVPHAETIAAHGFDQETIAIANRGQLSQWPLALIQGPGRASISDGMTNRMVDLPELQTSDGYVLLDTDPSNRTLTGSQDPVDNVFFSLIRQSTILDFFLHDLSALGLPVWRRANGIRFMSQIPPRTVANITVKHDNPAGSITVMIPQRYARPA